MNYAMRPKVLTAGKLPVYADAPTGPQARVLRHMLAGEPLVLTTTPAGVVAALNGAPFPVSVVAGLLTRRLIEEHAEAGPLASAYALTPLGREYAAGGRR